MARLKMTKENAAAVFGERFIDSLQDGKARRVPISTNGSDETTAVIDKDGNIIVDIVAKCGGEILY